MAEDTVFWIASMTKPVTAVAVMMLFDEGKLKPTDLVSKYIPEFADLKTPSGKPANLTITHILTHTSGLAEATGEIGSTRLNSSHGYISYAVFCLKKKRFGHVIIRSTL